MAALGRKMLDKDFRKIWGRSEGNGGITWGGSYWNPMCEWATIREHRMASMTGLREPAAKGAKVRGTRPTQTSLRKMLVGVFSTHAEVIGKCCIDRHCSVQRVVQTSQKTSGSCPRKGGLQEWEQGRSLSR